MTTHLLLIGVFLAAVGCAPVPINDYVSPTPTVSTAPVALTLRGSSRPAPDFRLDINAQVLTATGAPVPDVNVTFTFALGTGTFTAPEARTDAEGTARTIATTFEKTKITARAGALSATVEFIASNPNVPSALIVSLQSDRLVYASDTVNFFAAIPGDVAARSVTWEFGDGDRATTSGLVTTHRYGRAGRFTASARVEDTTGRTATDSTVVTVLETPPVIIPPPTPPPTLALAVTCANNTPRDITCTANTTYGTASANSRVASITWYWDDGSANKVVTGSPAAPTASHTFPATTRTYDLRATVLLDTGETLYRNLTYLIIGS